jgi:ABC-type Fe2+-enterobactin transport system substrate-binding protein
MQAIQKEINLFSTVFTNLYDISEFVILQKNGKNAGQSVAHLHFHMIPAPKPFDEIVSTAFHHREKISDEEMKLRTQELQVFLLAMSQQDEEPMYSIRLLSKLTPVPVPVPLPVPALSRLMRSLSHFNQNGYYPDQ